MKPRSKGMAYLIGTAATLLAVGIIYGFSHLIIPLYGTFNMGLAGLLIRTGLWAGLVALTVWTARHYRRKWAAGQQHPSKTVSRLLIAVSVLFTPVVIPTIMDLFTMPVTREFVVDFRKTAMSSRSRRPSNTIQLVAESDDEQRRRYFYTTRYESIEGLPRFSRDNLPPGRYKMRITYYPHSRTRVSTELIEKIATPK